MKTFLISGDRSGSGKTSITLAIAAALAKRWTIQTFKVGMDYIDPSYLTGVTGRPCRNLDSFVMNREELMAVFNPGTENAEFAAILKENNIEAEEACTLVLLSIGNY